MHSLRVLILGGTSEASALARGIADDSRFDATLSLAGITRSPATAPIAMRIGGFGGADGLACYLRAERIGALVDATHPFAVQISANALQAARETGTPLLAIMRPPWRAGPDDRWTMVPDMAEAAAALGRAPRRVLLTIGRKDLAPFAAASCHHYVIRSVDPPEEKLLPPNAEIITARGPFDEAAERRLLADRRIDVIVTKNSGGNATVAKLTAARVLGLSVIMVERPPPLPVETVPDAAGAMTWLLARHAASARRGV